MGFLRAESGDMSVEEARGLLGIGDDHMQDFGALPGRSSTMYFDYLKGRVMKVNLSGDEFDEWGYDRDNGSGAAHRALQRAGVL